jgi:hypothetical protein
MGRFDPIRKRGRAHCEMLWIVVAFCRCLEFRAKRRAAYQSLACHARRYPGRRCVAWQQRVRAARRLTSRKPEWRKKNALKSFNPARFSTIMTPGRRSVCFARDESFWWRADSCTLCSVGVRYRSPGGDDRVAHGGSGADEWGRCQDLHGPRRDETTARSQGRDLTENTS